MVAAVYTSDLTTLIPDDVISTGNWAALGGGASGLNVETDYFIQGNNCLSKNAWASATKGAVEDTTNTLLTTGTLDAVYTWVTHTTPGSLDIKANGGISIKMGTASNALNDYYYAGSDTVDYGAPWICAVIDPENSTASVGTIAGSVMDTYGAVAKLIGGPTKGAPFGIDSIRQGRSYEVTEGDSAAPATFAAAAAKNDLQANRYGQFQGVPGITGSFIMQCRLGIGTLAAACYFEDSNTSITLNDLEFVDPDFTLFEVVNVGSVVKWTNISISSVGTNAKGNFIATSSSSIELTTCTFNDMGTFDFDANSIIDKCTFRRTQLVSQNSSRINNSTFESSTATAAVKANNLSDITDCVFISDGTGYAIELTSIGGGSMDWSNTDSGYAATDGSTGNETIYVNVGSGTLDINVAAGASTPTIRTAGATVNVIVGAITLTMTVKDKNGAVIGAYAYIDNNNTAPFIMDTTTNGSGIATVSHSDGPIVGTTWRIRKYGYKPFIETVDISSSDINLPITLIIDPQQT